MTALVRPPSPVNNTTLISTVSVCDRKCYRQANGDAQGRAANYEQQQQHLSGVSGRRDRRAVLVVARVAAIPLCCLWLAGVGPRPATPRHQHQHQRPTVSTILLLTHHVPRPQDDGSRPHMAAAAAPRRVQALSAGLKVVHHAAAVFCRREIHL